MCKHGAIQRVDSQRLPSTRTNPEVTPLLNPLQTALKNKVMEQLGGTIVTPARLHLTFGDN